ncbi:hypothetical protein CPB84DRAFT_253564 [Gymnopilus junonius]|uniref:Uncharacterized protein n=1 Tax=Gymnopilus junonius TaxID=109634 RepID=A0A9P5NC73_GYMJU|nr:hypothetical protein CPB84DRAFT_253564 [Gymnopilus junonius]
MVMRIRLIPTLSMSMIGKRAGTTKMSVDMEVDIKNTSTNTSKISTTKNSVFSPIEVCGTKTKRRKRMMIMKIGLSQLVHGARLLPASPPLRMPPFPPRLRLRLRLRLKWRRTRTPTFSTTSTSPFSFTQLELEHPHPPVQLRLASLACIYIYLYLYIPTLP